MSKDLLVSTYSGEVEPRLSHASPNYLGVTDGNIRNTSEDQVNSIMNISTKTHNV